MRRLNIDKAVLDQFGSIDKKFRCRTTWLDLLSIAAEEEITLKFARRKLIVSHGQIALTHKQLCERWGYGSVNTVKKILRMLEENGLVRLIKHSNLPTLVEIVNYDNYFYKDISSASNVATSTRDCSKPVSSHVTSTPLSPSFEQSTTGRQESKSLTEEIITTLPESQLLLLAQLRNQSQLVEHMMCLHKLSQEEVTKALNHFILTQQAKCYEHKNWNDLRSHFIDWLAATYIKNQQQLQSRQYGTNKTCRTGATQQTRPTREQRVADAMSVINQFRQCSGNPTPETFTSLLRL